MYIFQLSPCSAKRQNHYQSRKWRSVNYFSSIGCSLKKRMKLRRTPVNWCRSYVVTLLTAQVFRSTQSCVVWGVSCCAPWQACFLSSLQSPYWRLLPAGSGPCLCAGVCCCLAAPSACSAPPSAPWWTCSSPPSQTPALRAEPTGWSAPPSTRGWRPPPGAAVPPGLSWASGSGLQSAGGWRHGPVSLFHGEQQVVWKKHTSNCFQ